MTLPLGAAAAAPWALYCAPGCCSDAGWATYVSEYVPAIDYVGADYGAITSGFALTSSDYLTVIGDRKVFMPIACIPDPFSVVI